MRVDAYNCLVSKSWRNFFIRRFFRLYPAYFLALIFGFLLISRGTHVGNLLKDFIFHMLLIHNFFQATIYSINPAMWSLATEVQFYIAYPLMLVAVAKLGFKKFINFLFVGTFLFLITFEYLTYGTMTPNPALWRNSVLLWFQWVLGAYLADRYMEGKRLFARPKIVLGVLVPFILVTSLIRTMEQFAYTTASIAFAVIVEWVLWSKIEPTRLLRALANLGICSYSFYLWHQPLLQILLRRLEPLHIGNEATRTIILVVFALGVIGPMSWVLYHYIEQPCQRIGKMMTARKYAQH